MGENLDFHVQEIFNTIFKALRDEDKYLIELSKRLHYKASDLGGVGIADLDEKHIQYILFKALIAKGNFQVYIEDPYKKGRGKCDLTLYDLNEEKSLWIEIKTTGWCKKWELIK